MGKIELIIHFNWNHFRSDGRLTYGVYNGVDYFYGGTTICYQDLWTKPISTVYDDDCQLPKSFSYLPYLSNLGDISPEENIDGIDTNRIPAIITTNAIGNNWKYLIPFIYFIFSYQSHSLIIRSGLGDKTFQLINLFKSKTGRYLLKTLRLG